MNQTNWRSIMKYALMLCALALLPMACSSSDSSPAPPTPLDTSTLNGIWSGTFGDNEDTILFMMRDGEIYAATFGDDIFTYSGTYTYSEPDTFTATLEDSVVTVTINGTASVEDQITVTYASSNGNKGNADLRFIDDYYNRESSLELMSGQWSNTKTDITIDETGGLTATQEACQLGGKISIIDPEHNLYSIDLDLTECEKDDGQYNGLAYLFDTDAGQNQSFMAVACNDATKRCIPLGADRQ